MSKLGHHNFFPRAHKTDAVVRSIMLERTNGAFFTDDGDLPMSQTTAYNKGVDGQDCVWTRRQVVHVLPPLPTDCIRPFDAGLAIKAQEREQLAAEDWAYYDEMYNKRDPDPMECAYTAANLLEFMADNDKWEQEERMWQLHEHPLMGTW